MSALAKAAERKAKEAAQKAAEDSKLAAGGGNIVVIMTRLAQGVALADRQKIRLGLSKDVKLKQIKARVELEMGIDRNEQNIFFRGRPVKDDEDMPLNNPELDTIVAEAGEKGLQMCIHHTPITLDPFLERESLVNEDGLVQLKGKFPTKATALHRAARRCDIFVCRELVANSKFDLCDAKDGKGQTALHVAVCCDFLEVVEIIVKCPRFTDPGAKDSEGKTALHYACFFGDHRIVKLILDHPKMARHHVLAKDKSGNTALMYAVHCGHEEAATTLLAAFPNLPRPEPLIGRTDAAVDAPSNSNVTESPAPESISEKQSAECMKRKVTVASPEEEIPKRCSESEPKAESAVESAVVKQQEEGGSTEKSSVNPTEVLESVVASPVVADEVKEGDLQDREKQPAPPSSQEPDENETQDAELKPEAVDSRVYTGECV